MCGQADGKSSFYSESIARDEENKKNDIVIYESQGCEKKPHEEANWVVEANGNPEYNAFSDRLCLIEPRQSQSTKSTFFRLDLWYSLILFSFPRNAIENRLDIQTWQQYYYYESSWPTPISAFSSNSSAFHWGNIRVTYFAMSDEVKC